jgi:hypothetical protein
MQLKTGPPIWLEKNQGMKDKAVVILQSNYIPWKGYFDLINIADEFIFHDDLQYTEQDWRNRNSIKTSDGVKWLSIPVGNNHKKLICEVEMKDNEWKKKHRKKIGGAYSGAAYYKEFEYILEELYNNDLTNLSQYNQYIIKYLCGILNIKTVFTNSKEYHPEGQKTERLIGILKKAKATRYITGPSAKNYLNEQLFKEAEIALEYFSYQGYLEYPQLHSTFVHEVSVIDLIFNTGKDSFKFLKSFRSVNKI